MGTRERERQRERQRQRLIPPICHPSLHSLTLRSPCHPPHPLHPLHPPPPTPPSVPSATSPASRATDVYHQTLPSPSFISVLAVLCLLPTLCWIGTGLRVMQIYVRSRLSKPVLFVHFKCPGNQGPRFSRLIRLIVLGALERKRTQV